MVQFLSDVNLDKEINKLKMALKNADNSRKDIIEKLLSELENEKRIRNDFKSRKSS